MITLSMKEKNSIANETISLVENLTGNKVDKSFSVGTTEEFGLVTNADSALAMSGMAPYEEIVSRIEEIRKSNSGSLSILNELLEELSGQELMMAYLVERYRHEVVRDRRSAIPPEIAAQITSYVMDSVFQKRNAKLTNSNQSYQTTPQGSGCLLLLLPFFIFICSLY